MMRRLLITGLFLTCAALPTLSFAQQPTPTPTQISPGEVSRISQEISNEILSPFCPGKTLDMCPSPNAAAVRREVQELAATGKSKKEIKEHVIATYGEEFRIIEPPAQDNAMLFTLIILGLLSAIALVYTFTRRRQEPAAKEDTSSVHNDGDAFSEEDQAYLERLRDEMKQDDAS